MGDDFNPVKFVVGGLLVAATFVFPAAGIAIGAGLKAAMLAAGTGLLQAGLAETPGATGVELGLDNSLDTQNPLPVVYGETILPLRLVDIRVDDNSPNRQDLWIVGALCHGSENGTGIEGIDEIYLDNVLAVDDAGVVQTFFDGYLSVQKYLGSDSQSVAEAVNSTYTSGFTENLNATFPTAWPTTSAGAGVACLVLRLTYNQQIYSGIPNITVSVRGNKVYDPRSASARGTMVGGAWSVTTGWVYSGNPALCIADYLLSSRYGMKFATSEVDCGTAGSDSTSSFSVMAAFCEQSVTKPDTTTDWRFTCSGALDVAQAPTENLRRLLSSCRGAVFWEGGQARLAIRDVATPTTFGLDESVIVGDWTFRAPGVTDAPNIILATYPDRAQNYRADTVQWPNPDATNTYLAADNGFESVVNIDLPMTVERWRAEQIALVTLKEMRSALSMQVTCREAALQCRVGDVTPVTHSFPVWSAKGFWITEVVFDPTASLVRLSAVAYDENAYDLDAQTQYPDAPATNLPNPTSIDPPSDVTLLCDATTASRLPDGAMVNRIKVTWTAPSDPFLNHYLFYGCKVGDSPRPLGLASAGDTEFYIGPVPSDELWQIQMTAVNGLGRESATTVAVTIGTAILGTETLRDNVLLNGGGQNSAAGSDAASWTLGAGAHLTVSTDKAKYGDRCLKIDSTGVSQISWSYQTVAIAAAGEVWEVYGWVHLAGGLGGSGEGAGVTLDTSSPASALTVLDYVGSYTDAGGNSGRFVYTPRTDASNAWQFLRLIVRCPSAATLRCSLSIGYATGCSGIAYFDGFVLHRLAPASSGSVTHDGTIYVPETTTIVVGTPDDPSPVITKTIRVPYTSFVAAGSGYALLGTEYMEPSVLNTVLDYLASVYLPKGVTITNVSFEAYRQTTNDVVTLEMRQGSDPPGSSVQKYTASHATTGWTLITHAAFSVLVGNEAYALRLTLKAVSALVDARFAWAELTYTMPSYDKTI